MQRTPFIERYAQGLILIVLCVVAAWTILVALFTVTGLLALALGSRQPDGVVSELSGPAMALIGTLILGGLWKLLRFVRRRGVRYPPE